MRRQDRRSTVKAPVDGTRGVTVPLSVDDLLVDGDEDGRRAREKRCSPFSKLADRRP